MLPVITVHLSRAVRPTPGDDCSQVDCAGNCSGHGVCIAPHVCACSPGFRGDDCGSYCGNGVVEAAETCDDGNNLPGDGCSDACRLETSWTCQSRRLLQQVNQRAQETHDIVSRAGSAITPLTALCHARCQFVSHV